MVYRSFNLFSLYCKGIIVIPSLIAADIIKPVLSIEIYINPYNSVVLIIINQVHMLSALVGYLYLYEC